MPTKKHFTKTIYASTSQDTKQPYSNLYLPRKTLIINNFFGGISWALGATIGVSLLLATVGFILSKINFIPFIGEFASQISHYVQQH